VARHFLTPLVTDIHDHRVLPRVFLRGMLDLPFDAQGGASLHLLIRVAPESKVVLTAGADARALEDDRLAMRALARLAR